MAKIPPGENQEISKISAVPGNLGDERTGSACPPPGPREAGSGKPCLVLPGDVQGGATGSRHSRFHSVQEPVPLPCGPGVGRGKEGSPWNQGAFPSLPCATWYSPFPWDQPARGTALRSAGSALPWPLVPIVHLHAAAIT